MPTETVEVVNTSQVGDWVQVADASHEYVTIFHYDAFYFYVGDDDPNSMINSPGIQYDRVMYTGGSYEAGIASKLYAEFAHLGSNMWVKVGTHGSIWVMRGDGRLVS